MIAWIYKLNIALVMMLIMMLSTSPVYAEIITVEADGYTILGSGDSQEVGYERARSDAKRNAAEQAGVYVSSHTIVDDGKLTKDEIESLSAAIMKVTVLDEQPELLAGKGIQLKVHIKATMDTDELYMAAYKRNALIEKENELRKIQAEYEQVKKDAFKNTLSLLNEQYMTTVLEQVILSNDEEKIRESAEMVIRLFPDNEVARLALLRLNYDKTGYIEDYLKKYPNDIYGQYFYLYVHNQLGGEEADKIIKRAREMISEDEFYSIVTPSVVLDIQLVATPNLYTKAGILWDMFAAVCDVAMVSNWDPLKDVAPANRIIYIYSQPNYVLSSDKGKKILDDYVKKYPPEYFITKRELEK